LLTRRKASISVDKEEEEEDGRYWGFKSRRLLNSQQKNEITANNKRESGTRSDENRYTLPPFPQWGAHAGLFIGEVKVSL
jgi:hypothetical protein